MRKYRWALIHGLLAETGLILCILFHNDLWTIAGAALSGYAIGALVARVMNQSGTIAANQAMIERVRAHNEAQFQATLKRVFDRGGRYN